MIVSNIEMNGAARPHTVNLLLKLCSLLLCLLSGCAHPHTSQPSTLPPEGTIVQRDYVDLKPGWRLRVVVPITRSGSYIAVSKEPSEGGDARVSADFLGYERSYYSVKARDGAGVRIDFIKAQLWEKGKFHSRPKTLLALLDPVANVGYVRLVYLIRASQADHNMALVAAPDPKALDALTKEVTSSAVCESVSGGICAWVPAGVAVTPEEELVVVGKKQWLPAR